MVIRPLRWREGSQLQLDSVEGAAQSHEVLKSLEPGIRVDDFHFHRLSTFLGGQDVDDRVIRGLIASGKIKYTIQYSTSPI